MKQEILQSDLRAMRPRDRSFWLELVDLKDQLAAEYDLPDFQLRPKHFPVDIEYGVDVATDQNDDTRVFAYVPLRLREKGKWLEWLPVDMVLELLAIALVTIRYGRHYHTQAHNFKQELLSRMGVQTC
jgi:hypothetical protein